MSAVEPAIFSLIGDYFPVNLKSTAIAIIIAGTFLGTSGSSLCIQATDMLGWRKTHSFMGFFGIATSILSYFILKEPVRNSFKSNQN